MRLDNDLNEKVSAKYFNRREWLLVFSLKKSI